MTTVQGAPIGAVEHDVFGYAFVTCRLPVELDREAHARFEELWARVRGLGLANPTHEGGEMIRAPFPSEWDMSQLPANRRAYLDSGVRLEELASRVHAELEFIRATVKAYSAPAPGEPKDARQVIFCVRVGADTCDLLYNAPGGLRACYWQSPDHGFTATRHLIGRLAPILLSFTERTPPTTIGKATPMASKDIRASLAGLSAKIWPRERGDNDCSLLIDDQLLVARWRENEQHAWVNKGMWRRTPKGGELEIKGAILGTDGTEYVPEGKRDRSCQIHRFGFT